MNQINGIKIYCNVTNTEFTVGSKSDYIPESDKVRFMRFIAREVSLQLIRAVDSQRLSRKWKPLNPDYLKWKKSQGYSTHIWECTGKLKSSIYYDIYNDRLVVGVDESVKYGKVSALTVARTLEYGSRRVPARPLFRPILLYIRSNVKYFYDKYIRLYKLSGGVIDNEIQKQDRSSRILQEYVRKHNLRSRR